MNPMFVTTAITLSLLASAAGADSIEEGSGGQLDDGFPEVQTAAATAADGEPYAASKEELSLSFIFHIDEEMTEQDVFYEKEPGSGEVWRPTAATREMKAPLYAPAVPVAHNFLDTTDTGPYPMGKSLGITLGEWFAAKAGDLKRFGDTASADWIVSDDVLTIVISEVAAHVLVVVEEA